MDANCYDMQRLTIVDTLIAATAIANELPVYSQDADFAAIPRVKVIRI